MTRAFVLTTGLFAAGILSACSPIVYAPDVVNAPLLRDAKDVRVSAHVGGGNEVDSLYQLNAAAAVNSLWGIYGSLYTARGTDHSNGSKNSGSGVLGSIGGGVHMFSSTNHVGGEAIGGVEIGHGHDSVGPTYRIDFHATKPFGQIHVGYRGHLVEAVTGVRFGHVSFSGIQELSQPSRPLSVADFLAHRSTSLYEPFLSLRVGAESVKFGFDYVSSSRGNHGVPVDDSAIAFGLYFTGARR